MRQSGFPIPNRAFQFHSWHSCAISEHADDAGALVLGFSARQAQEHHLRLHAAQQARTLCKQPRAQSRVRKEACSRILIPSGASWHATASAESKIEELKEKIEDMKRELRVQKNLSKKSDKLATELTELSIVKEEQGRQLKDVKNSLEKAKKTEVSLKAKLAEVEVELEKEKEKSAACLIS